MNKILKSFAICLFFIATAHGQTLSDLQQQNARATGYAIVAARNPGKSFAIYMIKWDGVHDLEYNANNQINPGWHPQAAIKGNYFDQTFVDNNFIKYSSVVVSQSEFDTYKSTGTDWWIVCSYLPSFSNSGISISESGNVGIGTSSPLAKLEVNGGNILVKNVKSIDNSSSIMIAQSIVEGNYTTLGTSINTINQSAGNNSYGMQFFTQESYLTGQTEKVRIQANGNVGIGTTNPNNKLDVNGTIHSKEVKVDMSGWPDYVFKKEYDLPTLEEVEKHIAEKGHLENIPSQEEVLKDGVNLGEMDAKLLQKIEELTLYMIEHEKKNTLQTKRIEELEKENRLYKLVLERVTKIEERLK